MCKLISVLYFRACVQLSLVSALKLFHVAVDLLHWGMQQQGASNIINNFATKPLLNVEHNQKSLVFFKKSQKRLKDY